MNAGGVRRKEGGGDRGPTGPAADATDQGERIEQDLVKAHRAPGWLRAWMRGGVPNRAAARKCRE